MRFGVAGLCVIALLACSRSEPPAPASDDDAGDAAFPEKPRAPSSLALRDIVGFSSHPHLGASAASQAERAFEWSKIAQLGIHRMRTDFTWATIQPARGTFDWSAYDPLVAEARAHGVDLLAMLGYGNAWATSAPGGDSGFPPDDPHDFGAFARAVAQRYASDVHEFEVWNEPNVGINFWKPTLDGDPAKYGALFAQAQSDLLAAQPGALVAYAGTAYHGHALGPAFVTQSFAANPALAPSLGTFAMHAYEIYPPSTAPESADAYEVPLLDKIATMSGVLDAAGAPPVPIWITEIGWPTMSDDPPAQQARYTVRAIVLGALGGADRVLLYTLLDGPNPDAYPPEDAFGIETYSDFADAGAPQDKPAFVAVRALMSAVGDYAVSKRLDALPDDAWIVELTKGAQRAWIVWRATDGAQPADVTVPASGNVAVTTVDGTVKNDVAGAGGYTTRAGPDPVIVSPR